jgi:heme oxygenase
VDEGLAASLTWLTRPGATVTRSTQLVRQVARRRSSSAGECDRSVILKSAIDLLRARTAEVHARIDSGLDLTATTVTRVRLRGLVRRLDEFWCGTEGAIHRWAVAAPIEAELLQWPRRSRRTEAVAWDLAVLGGTARETSTLQAPAVFSQPQTAEVFGWLYVREGSTLGGAVINARLRPLLGAATLQSFQPYPEGPQPMFRAYLTALESWVGQDAARATGVADAAVATFSALEDWLRPILHTTAGIDSAALA